MKIFFLILQFAVLQSAALVDVSVLAVNNTWEYEQTRTSGRSDDITFFGKTSVIIDSLKSRNDSLYFWSSWKESAYGSSHVNTNKTEHVIVNGNIFRNSVDGAFSDTPNYLLGSDLSHTVFYVLFAGKTRYLNKWIRYPPLMSFGDTKSGTYLQGVGAISYKTKTFAMLNQDGASFRLLSYNGTKFDSTKMEILGPVPLAPKKHRTVPAAKAGMPNLWKGKAHAITGRRL